MRENTMLAMILAEDQGSSVYTLAKKNEEFDMHCDGESCLIDFTLRNCVSSNIEVIGVLTGNTSILLHSCVTVGQCWDLDVKDSGVYILPPRIKTKSDFHIYHGVMDAMLQNIDFMSNFHPEYILILPGNSIYEMDYTNMLAHHQSCHADVTIAVMPIAMEEAHHFDIVNIDETDRILTFDVKPMLPKSNLASMEIYIFNWELLKKVLLVDIKKGNDLRDFKQDMISKLLEEGKNVYAYRFQGS